ncbi:signal peptidase II [Iamia sp. SCSIO 61187]|uniref:signal peptidase II n=1 Tax=Iamia sp. SCSIO 61187 TaxID=2722752 RepID=UPI001C62C406|nr:signal peptidase II [Iamia sp. SCSIO 61187]QYG92809.1 signal peptidase II [Iamia sp. SCSIO 61187]
MRAEDEAPAPARPRRARRPHVARAPLVAAVGVGLLVVDQLSKHWALNRLSDGRVVEVVGSLQLLLTWNTGASFSIGSDLELGPYIALLALVVVAWLLWSGHSATRLGAVAAGMVTGGALGNLVDRALRSGPAGAEAGFLGGAVVDFIDLQWWPIFNVADVGVVGGALLLVLASVIHGDPHDQRAARGDGPDGAGGS